MSPLSLLWIIIGPLPKRNNRPSNEHGILAPPKAWARSDPRYKPFYIKDLRKQTALDRRRILGRHPALTSNHPLARIIYASRNKVTQSFAETAQLTPTLEYAPPGNESVGSDLAFRHGFGLYVPAYPLVNNPGQQMPTSSPMAQRAARRDVWELP